MSGLFDTEAQTRQDRKDQDTAKRNATSKAAKEYAAKQREVWETAKPSERIKPYLKGGSIDRMALEYLTGYELDQTERWEDITEADILSSTDKAIDAKGRPRPGVLKRLAEMRPWIAHTFEAATH